MRERVRRLAAGCKGFLDDAEGMALHDLAVEAARRGPCLEIGSYCGKSALYLGDGCRRAGHHPLFTVDHHRGSEEQQPGQPFFDPDLYDAERGTMRTLSVLVDTVRAAGLDRWVIPIVADSRHLGPHWPAESLDLLFVDGSHDEAAVSADYDAWSAALRRGGYLCLHDVYPDPDDGGQAPYHLFQRLTAGDGWEHLGLCGSLATLRKR